MLTLRAGESSLVLAPEAGGGIVGWVLGSMPLLRRPSPDAVVSGDARGFGCFPLLPFCNRIAQARFVWEGRTYEIARNFGDSPHAIHGLGWQSRWELEKVAAGSATLSLRHEARGDAARRWPFAFEARQEVVLRANELSVTLRV